MENLGTEVGHKMRSAVKAKLIELGTGGSTGYIDDELPDYVMIMVANKRSKQQMTDDLNLFLGNNTTEFVTWLHTVLEKLQEVTLSTSAISQKNKRKSSESNDKKDKKDKKKKLKRNHKSKDEQQQPLPPPPSPPPISSSSLADVFSEDRAPPSITDVFAEHLIQKAQKTKILADGVNVKTKDENETAEVQSPPQPVNTKSTSNEKSVDEFDIPTISEIAQSAAGVSNRRRDLNELAELQRKINQAKKHLKALGNEESEDEDFININDGEDIQDEEDVSKKQESTVQVTPGSASKSDQPAKPNRVPITFDDQPPPPRSSAKPPSRKRSIMDRLGVRPAAANRPAVNISRRVEKEIYVPIFRRKEEEKKSERERERERDRDRDREQRDREKQKLKLKTDLRNRVREKEKLIRNDTKEITIKNKIGSRIIVAPPKPIYDQDTIEVPVNSVVKVQPRPTIPSNKQANKNLLLRAVAEAQKSTALVKPRKEPRKQSSSPSATTKSFNRTQKLYTKSYRDGKSRKFNKDQSNILIEVSTEPKIGTNNSEEMIEHVEYISDDYPDADEDGYVYIPVNMGNSDEDLYQSPYEQDEDRTQFVITINEDNTKNKYHSTEMHDDEDTEKNGLSSESKTVKNKHLDTVNNKPRTSSPLRLEATTQKVNKLIIQNDTEDEEELRKEVERSTTPSRRSKRSNVSPIKFDIIDSPSPIKRAKSHDDGEDKSKNASKEKHEEKVLIKRSDSTSKYDNLPPLSSAITTVSVTDTTKKLKDRCKYFPTCGKGDGCEFYHPNSPCKSFPNCKYGDKCLYLHPKCKFDLTCNRLGCNFSHTPIVSAAPPLSSHVVPVTNYKSITTSQRSTPALPAMCKFYPNCSNTMCTFYHPKPCRFGKNCNNKVECNFYHFDLPGKDKLKWVASNV